jgi:hypothetical protein
MEVTMKTGVEGPKHDPYGTETWTITGEYKGAEITLTYHQGLDEWFTIDTSSKVRVNYDGGTLKLMSECCEKLTGKTFDEVRGIWEEKEYGMFCETCNDFPPDVTSHKGYPGETIYCCTKCSNPVNSFQDMSAVI